MAVANLNNEKAEIITGNDNIVIIDDFESIRGGRTLDVTGFTPEVINAGHVIIKDSEGEYKPMPLNAGGDAYATLPEGASYAGILKVSILTKRPMAAILVRGSVNIKAMPFPVTSILAALKTALPLINFTED